MGVSLPQAQATRGASEGHKPVQGELSREEDPGLGASPYPPCCGAQAHTQHTYTPNIHTCTHAQTQMCAH